MELYKPHMYKLIVKQESLSLKLPRFRTMTIIQSWRNIYFFYTQALN